MRSHWTLAIVLCAACAEVELPGGGDGGAAGETDGGALVGRVGGGAGDAGDALPPLQGCTPGERLAVCVVCDAAGQPATAEDDPECPAIACADRFEEAPEGGDTVCWRVPTVAQGGNCADQGLCVADPASRCAPGERVEVARALGPCQRLEGCLAGAPAVANAIPGTACNGPGACREDGTCSAGASEGDCGLFSGLQCGQGLHDDGTPFCEVYVVSAGQISCDGYCAAQGSRCLAAFDDRGNGCRHGDAVRCDGESDDLVCRCARP
jgi:hypothetical protein